MTILSFIAITVEYFIFALIQQITFQEQQIKEQQKKKKAQAAAKRKVTRSSSLSSEASSSDSDTSSQAAASGSADTSDDSDSDPEVKLKKASPKDTKVNKKAPPKKVKTGATPKGKKETTAHQKKMSNRDLLSSEDESMASTAASSAAVSPSKATGKKSANGARPNTRQRGGSNMRRSRHVTGKNHAGLIDTDSDMEMTSTANESVGSSPRKKTGRGRYQKSAQKTTEKKKTSSFSGDDSQGEEIPKRKNTSVRDRATIAQEAAVTAAKVTERILTSRNLDRQASSPSGEGFGTFNRGSNNSHPAQPPANHHGNGTYPSEVTLPPVRRTFEGCTPIEDKKCPTPGCDSTGHFSGTSKYDYHFTQDACPLYHNTVKKECKDFRIEINKKHSARRKAAGMMAGARSPLGSPSTEQKRHAQMVIQLASRMA